MSNIDYLSDIVCKLTNVYLEEEDWHDTKLTPEQCCKYFSKLLLDGNIFFVEEKGQLLGYCECWRLDYSQWGRYVCHETISPFDEDITLGTICVVHNVWIRKDKRRSWVTKRMIKMFYELNSMCDYYVGHALRKTSSQPIKVFKKENLKSSLFTKGEYYGR